MNGEVIAVGNELISGQVANANAAFLSEKLLELGVCVHYHQTVGDEKEKLKNALTIALHRSQLIIMTGGLGPTEDDITKEVTASTLGLELIFSEQEYRRIQSFFKRLNRSMSSNNKKQAYIPSGAEILVNEIGTASGLCIHYDEKLIVMLPGPPRELAYIFHQQLAEKLQKEWLPKQNLTFQKTNIVKLIGMGESKVDEKLSAIHSSLPPGIQISPLAKRSQVHLVIKAFGEQSDLVDEKINRTKKLLAFNFGTHYWGEDDETLESLVISRLKALGLTIALAESVTGGLISNRLTHIPGSSQVYAGGVCCYSDESKMSLLNVPKSMIDAHTSVSREVTHILAKHVRTLFSADIGLAVTGYAGPGGEKPGLVYIALSSREKTLCEDIILPGCRQDIKEGASNHALNYLRWFVVGEKSQKLIH